MTKRRRETGDILFVIVHATSRRLHEAQQHAFVAIGDGRCRSGYARIRTQGGFDLAQFDAMPAQFHLSVVTAEELEFAAWQITSEVAGAIQARAVRMPDEALLGERRVAEVTDGQSRTRDIEITGHPGRPVLEALV